MSRWLLIVLTLISSLSCNSASVSGVQDTRRSSSEAAQYAKADLRILFIGNSHTSFHGMPKLVQQMLNARQGSVVSYCRVSVGGMFLADRLSEPATLNEIKRGGWDYVVLQSQKYSTSGRYTYPTDAAIELTKLAQQQGAKVLMYPEFARRDHPEEFRRIDDLHQAIAEQTGASVVPIGVAWNEARQQRPQIKLHEGDGNHFNPTGAFLTACVFFAAIADQDPRELTHRSSAVSPETQEFLKKVAWETVQTTSTPRR